MKVTLRKTGEGIAMTDVVEIANERRDALAAEIDKLAAEIGLRLFRQQLK